MLIRTRWTKAFVLEVVLLMQLRRFRAFRHGREETFSDSRSLIGVSVTILEKVFGPGPVCMVWNFMLYQTRLHETSVS